jgi:hypothetical protein
MVHCDPQRWSTMYQLKLYIILYIIYLHLLFIYYLLFNASRGLGFEIKISVIKKKKER